MTLAEYAELKGNERLRFELESKANLYEEANRLFTLIIAALAGCLGYLFTLFEKSDNIPALAAALAATAHLMIAAGYVMHKALAIRGIAPMGNEPAKILAPGNEKFELDQIISVECENIQGSIERNVARNEGTGRAIIFGRCLLICAPITSILAWMVALCLG